MSGFVVDNIITNGREILVYRILKDVLTLIKTNQTKPSQVFTRQVHLVSSFGLFLESLPSYMTDRIVSFLTSVSSSWVRTFTPRYSFKRSEKQRQEFPSPFSSVEKTWMTLGPRRSHKTMTVNRNSFGDLGIPGDRWWDIFTCLIWCHRESGGSGHYTILECDHDTE